MTPLKVRGLTLGEGRPKICVPVMGRTSDEICSSARALLSVPAELAEWRADWYKEGLNPDCVRQVLTELREILKEMPILFTFRTASEGGEQPAAPDQYIALNRSVCADRLADLIDIEYSMGTSAVSELIQAARQAGVRTVLSSHDFRRTPPAQEILSRLQVMERAGADLPKVAVMPQSQQDVMELLQASLSMKQSSQVPFITVSMAQTGVISRLAGEFFGSAFTFGTAAGASAPGQISARDLKQALEAIHNGLTY